MIYDDMSSWTWNQSAGVTHEPFQNTVAFFSFSFYFMSASLTDLTNSLYTHLSCWIREDLRKTRGGHSDRYDFYRFHEVMLNLSWLRSGSHRSEMHWLANVSRCDLMMKSWVWPRSRYAVILCILDAVFLFLPSHSLFIFTSLTDSHPMLMF